MKLFVTILNSETNSVDIVEVEFTDDCFDIESYLQEKLNYSLTNCQWMCTEQKPIIEFI